MRCDEEISDGGENGYENAAIRRGKNPPEVNGVGAPALEDTLFPASAALSESWWRCHIVGKTAALKLSREKIRPAFR